MSVCLHDCLCLALARPVPTHKLEIKINHTGVAGGRRGRWGGGGGLKEIPLTYPPLVIASSCPSLMFTASSFHFPWLRLQVAPQTFSASSYSHIFIAQNFPPPCLSPQVVLLICLSPQIAFYASYLSASGAQSRVAWCLSPAEPRQAICSSLSPSAARRA